MKYLCVLFVPQLGSEFLSADCQILHTCVKGNKVQRTTPTDRLCHSTNPNTLCQVTNGVTECTCMDGFEPSTDKSTCNGKFSQTYILVYLLTALAAKQTEKLTLTSEKQFIYVIKIHVILVKKLHEKPQNQTQQARTDTGGQAVQKVHITSKTGS